jgi:hypothetical protein
MFSGNFAKGFVTGLAKTVSKEIDDDMQQTEDNISRLAALRLERAANNEATNKKTRTEKASELKSMVSYLDGSTDAAQWMIDTYGYDRARVVAQNLAKQKQSLGLDPLDQIGLAQRNGASVTLDQLIDSNTPYLSLGSLDSVKGSVAVGFGKMFGGDDAASARLKDLSEGMMTAAGVEIPSGEDALKTMPPVLQGNLKEYMLGRLDTPKEEAERLYMLANNLQAKGKKEEASTLRNEAEALMLIENAVSVSASGEQKWKRSDVDAAGLNIGEALALNNGINAKKTPTGLLVDANTKDTMRSEYTKKQAYLTNILDKYVKANGVNSYPDALTTIKTAIADNHMVTYVPPADDDSLGTFVVDKDTLLFNATPAVSNASNAIINPGGGSSSLNTTPAASGGGAAAINAPSPAQLIVDQLLQEQPGSPKANALKNILIRNHPGTAIPQGY